MHLPPESEWVFEVISDKAKKLIVTIENERWESVRAWPRDYDRIFRLLGWECIDWHNCGAYKPLPDATIKRVFTRISDQ